MLRDRQIEAARQALGWEYDDVRSDDGEDYSGPMRRTLEDIVDAVNAARESGSPCRLLARNWAAQIATARAAREMGRKLREGRPIGFDRYARRAEASDA